MFMTYTFGARVPLRLGRLGRDRSGWEGDLLGRVVERAGATITSLIDLKML